MARKVAQKSKAVRSPAIGAPPKRPGIIEKFLGGGGRNDRNTVRKNTGKFKKAK